jgi:hypothetical protein
MIGFNGGLIGGLATDRNTSLDSAKGVWTLPEQRNAKLANLWPLVGLKLLDVYTGASAAYSLRQLSSSYTGSLVTVRRSVDDEEQGFTESQIIGSGAGSLADFCSGTDGFVKTWHDQSGNGNNATQSTAANQPQIFSSATDTVDTSNGKPCLTYSSAGSSNLTLTTRLTGVVSVFQVLQITSSLTTDSLNFTLGDSSNYDYHPGGTYWLLSGVSANSVLNGSNRINNEVETLTTTEKTTNQTLISMVHSGTATVSTLTQDRGYGDRSLRGNMQELILYSSSQTSNVAGINADINLHYSIYV